MGGGGCQVKTFMLGNKAEGTAAAALLLSDFPGLVYISLTYQEAAQARSLMLDKEAQPGLFLAQ